MATISDIVNRIYYLTGATGDTSATVKGSYPNADLLISINAALNRVASFILTNDLDARWDDFNQTDLPIDTFALVADQQDYSISSAHLIIERVEIKNESGDWTLLTPIDQSLLKKDRETAMSEYQETAGDPIEYDIVGNSIFLYPKSSYSQAASGKIYYARGPADFTDAHIWTAYAVAGTRVPGFNSLFHDLISLIPAYEYSAIFKPDRARFILAELTATEERLKNFPKRQSDIRPRILPQVEETK